VKNRIEDMSIAVRGAGELASAVIRRLAMAGFKVIALEKAEPECVRRAVCFAEAVYDGEITIEGLTGVLANTLDEAREISRDGRAPVVIDPDGNCIRNGGFDAVVDARMLKRGIDTIIDMAPIVIGLGPGFVVGRNCHAAVETNRGIDLGRALYRGSPQADTGIPAPIEGNTVERVLRSPIDGVFRSSKKIGDQIRAGDEVGDVAGKSVSCSIGGVLRGIVRSGIFVSKNQKIGDIDPRGVREDCFKISDKANAVAGGALEAILFFRGRVR